MATGDEGNNSYATESGVISISLGLFIECTLGLGYVRWWP